MKNLYISTVSPAAEANGQLTVASAYDTAHQKFCFKLSCITMQPPIRLSGFRFQRIVPRCLGHAI